MCLLFLSFAGLLFPLVALLLWATPPHAACLCRLPHRITPPRTHTHRRSVSSTAHRCSLTTLRRHSSEQCSSSHSHRHPPLPSASAALSAAALCPLPSPPWRPTNWRTAPRLHSSSSITTWQEYSIENPSTKVRNREREGRGEGRAEEDEAAGRQREWQAVASGLAYEKRARTRTHMHGHTRDSIGSDRSHSDGWHHGALLTPLCR